MSAAIEPAPGLKVVYSFVTAEYRMEEHELTIHSVDRNDNLLETSHGTMTLYYWRWLEERNMIRPLSGSLVGA